MTADYEGRQTTGAGEDRLAERTVECVAFLTRSEHRFHVLDRLTDGVSSRDELRDQLDATRATLSRILGDLEDRELIRRRGVRTVRVR